MFQVVELRHGYGDSHLLEWHRVVAACGQIAYHGVTQALKRKRRTVQIVCEVDDDQIIAARFVAVLGECGSDRLYRSRTVVEAPWRFGRGRFDQKPAAKGGQ